MIGRWGASKLIFCLALIIITAVSFPLPFSSAQENVPSVPFSPQTKFSIPPTNGSVTFAMGGSYSNVTLEDNMWNFTGLNLNGESSSLPIVSGAWLSISAEDSQMTITKFNRLNVFPPMGSGNLEYTVSGTGVQTVNIHYYYNEWLNYTVTIDGQARAENDGWSVTKDGWLTIIGANSQVKITFGARSLTALTDKELFAIPELNSTINFGGTGTCVYADLENDTWRFQNLALNGLTPRGAPHWALAISAKNCNVTVTGFLAPFGTLDVGWLNYTVVGDGIQTFNGNIDDLGSFPLNYTAYIDGENKLQNDSWTVSGDDWVNVVGAKSDVNISFAPIIPDWFKNLPPPGIVSTPQAPEFSSLYMTSATIVAVSLVLGIFAAKRMSRKKT